MLESSSTEAEFILPKAKIRIESPHVFDYYERPTTGPTQRRRLNLTKIAFQNLITRPRIIPAVIALLVACLVWLCLTRYVDGFWADHLPIYHDAGDVVDQFTWTPPPTPPITDATPQQIVDFISRTFYAITFLIVLLPGIRLCLKQKARAITSIPLVIIAAALVTGAVKFLKIPALWYVLNQPGAFAYLPKQNTLEYAEVLLCYIIPLLGLLFFFGPLLPTFTASPRSNVKQAFNEMKGNRMKLGAFMVISNLAWIAPFLGAWRFYDLPCLIFAAFAFEWHCRNLDSLAKKLI